MKKKHQMVRATKRGEYNRVEYRPGMFFYLDGVDDFDKSWMEKAGGTPAYPEPPDFDKTGKAAEEKVPVREE